MDKILHVASQDSDFAELHVAEPQSTQSTGTPEQPSPQLAIPAGIGTNARTSEQAKNAKAASQTMQPAVSRQPPSSQSARAVLSTAATDALIEGLDPHDQPLVAYINRSSVPRILRQVQAALLFVCAGHACWAFSACKICYRHMAGCAAAQATAIA